MPVDPSATVAISAFSHVPPFARGSVRDIRVRWALEEIGRPYRTRLMDAFAPRPDDYRQWQPFGQVPAFDDGEVRLFESGAILLYRGEHDERLLPRSGQARWDATAWLIAALNSVEPMLMQVVALDFFHKGKDWAAAARPDLVPMAEARLKSVSAALGTREWLAGQFSVADIMMVTVLRNVRHTALATQFDNLAAYIARGEARPAFQRALADQCAEQAQEQAGEPA